MRLLLALISFVAAFAVVVPAAAAQSDSPDAVERAKVEVEQAGKLTQKASDLAGEGNRDAAYDVARTAYLDHFEYAEIPLRLREPDLVLDMEFKFAAYRDAIQSGAPMSEVRDQEREILRGLDDVERSITEKGIAAPAVAFAFSFTILFREGLEAVLLIAILLGSLEAARARNYRRPLAWGAAAAIAASIATFALTLTVLEIAPVDRELLEGGAAVLAVLVLVMVCFWLVSRLEHRRWMEFMRSRVSAAVATGGALAFAGLGFTAIYREGFETVLFYQALVLFADGLMLWVALGAAVAAGALVGVGYAILKLGKRLPIKPLLIGGAAMLLLLSVAFAGNAVRSLQGADVIGVTPINGDWARLPIFIAEMTGIHPTVEGIAVQAALLATFVAGALWVFLLKPRIAARRALPTEAAQQ
jgi:high-affinity iron transporter